MSQFTAISRSRPSAPARWLHEHGLLQGRLLDYGCGRGFDADYYQAAKWDPHWFPTRPDVAETGGFGTALCTYVLNVVSEEAQEQILADLTDLAHQSFISVRRDIPRAGQQGRDCWQRYVELPLPIVHQTPSYAIYHLRPQP